ncbi:antibiotic biosynthesis monooxygenase [Nocardia sp. NPDC052112]|uniref:putative quinol monooxygenase n=1 Tax=Nocardia sp. NPDC052112 TaxID=3155646 RepID=UPI003420C2B1
MRTDPGYEVDRQVSFTAADGKAEALAEVLEHALPHIRAEDGTPVWLASRSVTEPSTCYLVDVFVSPEAQQAHLTGRAAKLILGEGSELLAEPPFVSPLSVIAVKNESA